MTHLLLLVLLGCPNPTTSETGDAPDLLPRTVELFGPSPHTGLIVRLHHREGVAPDPAALDRLRDALADLEASGHVVKPGGVRVEIGTTLPASPDPAARLSFDTLDADLEGVRGSFVEGDAAVVHGLYSDGEYDSDGTGTVLGFAYGGARMVMMKRSIDESCDGALTALPGALADDACATLEASVLLHELGHLFGLVDNGLAMVDDHKDPDHGAHDSNTECLMYWAAERPDYASTLAGRFLGGDTSMPGFDDACLADMTAALEEP